MNFNPLQLAQQAKKQGANLLATNPLTQPLDNGINQLSQYAKGFGTGYMNPYNGKYVDTPQNPNQSGYSDGQLVGGFPGFGEGSSIIHGVSGLAHTTQAAHFLPAIAAFTKEMGYTPSIDSVIQKSPEASVVFSAKEPNTLVQKGAQLYNQLLGLPAIIEGHNVPVNQQNAQTIGKAYEQLPKVDTQNPQVKKAYAALANEVQQQWDFARNHLGINFEPWNQSGQPYANSQEMMQDVRDNKHLSFFTGGEQHPLLNQPDEQGLTLNDKFRAIHDLFGHAAEGFSFGPRGEENAWLKHSQMFSPDAQQALTTETRGQNSWVNFGPQNYDQAGNYLNIPATQRPFAQQKVALLPQQHQDWQSPLAAWQQSKGK